MLGAVAQGSEQSPYKAQVDGSNPSSPTCPKKTRTVYQEGRCGELLSPGFAHCTEHITDREFFARLEVERMAVPDEVNLLVKQIVGVEKAIKFKGMKGSIENQWMSYRQKFGQTVKELPSFADRMACQKALKAARTKADTLSLTEA